MEEELARNPDALLTYESPTVPDPITIDELLNSLEVIKRKEEADKAMLETIGEMSHEELRTKLLAWAQVGFPNTYELSRIVITPPNMCSDGVNRGLLEYIQFCSGKQIHEHVAVLAQKTSGMTIAYVNYQTYIAIVVTKV